MQRFFLNTDSKKSENVIIKDKSLINQITNILRYQEGDKFMVLFNDGDEYLVIITKISKKEINCQIIEKRI